MKPEPKIGDRVYVMATIDSTIVMQSNVDSLQNLVVSPPPNYVERIIKAWKEHTAYMQGDPSPHAYNPRHKEIAYRMLLYSKTFTGKECIFLGRSYRKSGIVSTEHYGSIEYDDFETLRYLSDIEKLEVYMCQPINTREGDIRYRRPLIALPKDVRIKEYA